MTKPWHKFYSDEALNFDPENMDSQTLAALCDNAAQTHGDNPALSTILPNGAEATVSYRELRDHADAFAAYLREVVGLKAGETVALMSPNCIGFCVASLGIAKAGCVSTNVNPLYTWHELEHQLTDSNAQVLAIIDLFGDKVDKVMDQTNIRHVVTLSLMDFFPEGTPKPPTPPIETAHVALSDALEQGREAARGVGPATYSAHVSPQDTAVLQYTSGTTGRSKGAELHHLGILANAYQAHLLTAPLHDPETEGALKVVVALPLYHITAFSLIFVAGIAQGSHCLLVPSPRPPSNLKAVFEKHQATWFTGINTLYAAMLAEPWFDRKLFENLRFSGSGGAAQQSGVAQKWTEATGVEISQGYGMTEISGVLTLNPPGGNRLGTVGIPVPGAEVRIVDENGNDVPPGAPGEVLGKSVALMKGYLNRPDATAETLRDGWLHTGDIGVMDEDGYLEIVDRKKDMILVSGFNVSPNEIEDVISTLPGVVQVGVIGIPDEKSAEVPAAFVVRADPALGEDDVLAVCRENLTNYKVPRRVTFVDEVPITPSGKVLRRKLRDDYLAS